MIRRNDNIALICGVGFYPYLYPPGIAQLKKKVESCSPLQVDNYYLSNEFTAYLEKYHPHLRSINENICEEGFDYNELYFSAKIFGHRNYQDIFRETLLNYYNNTDIYGNINNVKRMHYKRIPPYAYYLLKCMDQYCRLLEKFLLKKLRVISLKGYSLIGFSCLSSQLLSSIYLAKILRQTYDYKGVILFGGGMFVDWNVTQYRKLFPFVNDFIIGDGTGAILNATMTQRTKTQNTTFSNAYDFKELGKITMKGEDNSFPLRLSDGCSWGRCLFCGILPKARKEISSLSVVEKIRYFSKKYNAKNFIFVDCDLNGNQKNLESFCMEIIKNKNQYDFYGFLNTRNVTRKLGFQLKKAGINEVLLGVENFSRTALQRMKKKSRVMDNIKSIKWLSEARVRNVAFNIIIDFPGTTQQEVDENILILQMIEHLMKNNVTCHFIEFDLERNSKAFKLRKTLRIKDIENFKYNELCYPESLAKRLKFHSIKYNCEVRKEKWMKYIKYFKGKRGRKAKLQFKNKGSNKLIDTRYGYKEYELNEQERQLYIFLCRNVCTKNVLKARARLEDINLDSFLENLIHNKLLYFENDEYIGLART